jgi:tryptophan synthase alpha chain
MNRIDQLFQEKKDRILNIYFTAGFPALDDTLPVLRSLQRHGADMAEVGIPFSDSLADGPVIQQSNGAALSNGMSLPLLFEQLKDMRKEIHIPVILMGSFNPVMQFGMEFFLRTCADTGVDGVILPDLPLQEFETHYAASFDKYGIHPVFLVTPETSDDRLRKIDSLSRGFIYAVSSSSTTGKAKNFGAQKEYFRHLQQMQLQNPVLVGFGIRDQATFDAACANTRGAVIGTAYIQLLAAHRDTIDEATAQFISQITRP